MITRKSKQQEVTCPHCQATQSEPEGAISTNCKACGRYFKLDASRGTKVKKGPKASREVFCIKCGAPNLVAQAALSTQCIRCQHYLELGDKVIKGEQTGKLYAYDDVIFAAGCSFRGLEATGRRIEVRGKVFSKLRATAEIVALDGALLSGELHAPLVRIDRGAKVKVQTVDCGRLQVSGDIEISGALTANEVVLSDGATFAGQLQMPEAKFNIEKGVTVKFQSMTCDELAVDGTVTLGESLSARKISVGPGGTLTAPRFCVTEIDVSAGGTLQGHIEKYDPPVIAPAVHPSVETAHAENGIEIPLPDAEDGMPPHPLV